MQYTFETPFINRLRRALGAPSVLVESILCLVGACLFGIYSLRELSYIMLCFAVLLAVAAALKLTAFCGAHRRAKMLSALPCSLGTAASLVVLAGSLAAAGLCVCSNLGLTQLDSAVFALGLDGLISGSRASVALFCAVAVYSLAAFMFLLAARSSVKNNRPHTVAAVIFTVASFLEAAILLGVSVYGVVLSSAEGILLSEAGAYYASLDLICFAVLFASGVSAMKYTQLSGAVKK